LEVLGHLPEARSAVGRTDGTIAHLTGLLGKRPWFEMHVSGASVARRRTIELVCVDGVAWLSAADDDAIGMAPNGVIGTSAWERRPISNEMPLLAELRAFVDHLGGGAPPKSSAVEGAQAVSTIAELRSLAGLDA
jgi:hypothetical protein